MTRGFQLEKAGPASLIRNLDVVFAFLFQVGLLGDPATPLSLMGAVLILMTTAIMYAVKSA
jgi:drug/metabolite transporter (DMT)-like permease